jgi:hypothetical protein
MTHLASAPGSTPSRRIPQQGHDLADRVGIGIAVAAAALAVVLAVVEVANAPRGASSALPDDQAALMSSAAP